MTDAQIRESICSCILSRLSGLGTRRDEAVRDVLRITVPHLDDKAIADMTSMTPELPLSLYKRWVLMFINRLLETTDREQLKELCLDTEENNAALLLLYSMFMESARMEKIVAEDIKALAIACSATGAPDFSESGGIH